MYIDVLYLRSLEMNLPSETQNLGTLRNLNDFPDDVGLLYQLEAILTTCDVPDGPYRSPLLDQRGLRVQDLLLEDFHVIREVPRD